MSDLATKQHLFTRLVARLIDHATSLGYELSLGEVYRPPETAALYAKQGIGIANSLHCSRLAVDLNVWKDGTYSLDIVPYRALGMFWLSLDPLCAWGGQFTHPDPNHYSIRYEGRA